MTCVNLGYDTEKEKKDGKFSIVMKGTVIIATEPCTVNHERTI